MKVAIDIQAYLAEEAERLLANPTGQTFLVLTDDEGQAATIGPMLAARLHPERRWGETLHVESFGDGTCEVSVRDLGRKMPRPAGAIDAPTK